VNHLCRAFHSVVAHPVWSARAALAQSMSFCPCGLGAHPDRPRPPSPFILEETSHPPHALPAAWGCRPKRRVALESLKSLVETPNIAGTLFCAISMVARGPHHPAKGLDGLAAVIEDRHGLATPSSWLLPQLSSTIFCLPARGRCCVSSHVSPLGSLSLICLLPLRVDRCKVAMNRLSCVNTTVVVVSDRAP